MAAFYLSASKLSCASVNRHLSIKMLFPSISHVFAVAVLAAPLVAAHGKVSVATGDQGGNGTALGSK